MSRLALGSSGSVYYIDEECDDQDQANGARAPQTPGARHDWHVHVGWH
jgi:hypothetical protein